LNERPSNEPNLGSPHHGLFAPEELNNKGFFSIGKEKKTVRWRAEPPTVVRRLYEERHQDYDYLAEGEPPVIWEATVFNVENIYYETVHWNLSSSPNGRASSPQLKKMIIRSFILLLFFMNKMSSSGSSFIISIFPSGSLKKREKDRRATQEPRL